MAPSDLTAKLPGSAITHCRDVTRDHSKTFYFGSRFFGPAERQAVWAVYAVCRHGDDIVDEGDPHSAPRRLEAWWHGVQGAFAGTPSADPVFQALCWAVARFPIPRGAFEELHLGLRMDLDGHHYRDMTELELYCRRVAGVVGFMIAPIAGFDGGEATLQRALKLGQAMQLTNILRDVGEDAARGRLYLPEDLLSAYRLRARDIHGATVSSEYQALMRHLVATARTWYAEGRSGIPRLRGRARLAVGAAASAYEGILDALEQNDFDNFSRRAQVSGTRKLLMLPGVLWRSRGAPG
ncbi:phytoene/squalene synthase family protein [Deinococcus peraridilitoris]|uniref:Phytoene/squalene synthetase n=1 Tax=Deinococcus peraridilitoris (strain DSM 19664 / LMG 22246 / CIP 109416 / KR-200) TaxID=937777 RepID=L0A567_DEIPD|nr:phytoene/squalene synthase family protein [Deinococcus peraridilitoris]AFZ68584.1 phytoene/squalene synthetase [Deinococcus peraridilitoris DSM 19664]